MPPAYLAAFVLLLPHIMNAPAQNSLPLKKEKRNKRIHYANKYGTIALLQVHANIFEKYC